MAAREVVHSLSGKVQFDDTYLGGEHPGDKPGCGSRNKVPFVAAVSLDNKGGPLYVKLQRLKAFTSVSIKAWGCGGAGTGLPGHERRADLLCNGD